jgi:hypothetical protein
VGHRAAGAPPHPSRCRSTSCAPKWGASARGW